MEPGSLLVSLHGGRNFVGFNGAEPRTFVLVSTLDKKGNRSESKRSHTALKDTNPHWDMQLIFDVDENVDQVELEVYDREGIIVDELLGSAFVPHHRVTLQQGVSELWLPVIHPGKQALASSAGSSGPTPGPGPEMCISMRYVVDADEKAALETAQRSKSEARQRRKEMKKLFSIDEEYFHDFSCSLDRGTIPRFGRVYLTSTMLLFNSAFKQKLVDFVNIRSIVKYKTAVLANEGVTLILKGSRKLHLTSLKHRQRFLDAIATQVRHLGIPPIPVVDREASDEHTSEMESEDETESSVQYSRSDALSSTPNAKMSSPALLSSSPPADAIYAQSSPSQTTSPPGSFSTRSSSRALKDLTGDADKSTNSNDKREKDMHKRSQSSITSVVKAVSDKLRIIGTPSTSASHNSSKDPSPAPGASSSGITEQRDLAQSSQSTNSLQTGHNSALAASSPAPFGSGLQASTSAGSLATSSSTLQGKNKEKSSIFGPTPTFLKELSKELSIQFHLPSIKKKPSPETQSTPSPPTAPVDAGSLSDASSSSSSSSDTELDESDREREVSRRLKYYLIHGEVPAGSGEEESDLDSSHKKSKLKRSHLAKASNAIWRMSLPQSSTHTAIGAEDDTSNVDNMQTASGSANHPPATNSSSSPRTGHSAVFHFEPHADTASSSHDIFVSPRADSLTATAQLHDERTPPPFDSRAFHSDHPARATHPATTLRSSAPITSQGLDHSDEPRLEASPDSLKLSHHSSSRRTIDSLPSQHQSNLQHDHSLPQVRHSSAVVPSEGDSIRLTPSKISTSKDSISSAHLGDDLLADSASDSIAGSSDLQSPSQASRQRRASTSSSGSRRRSAHLSRSDLVAQGIAKRKESKQDLGDYRSLLSQEKLPYLVMKTGLFSFALAFAILLRNSGASLLNSTMPIIRSTQFLDLLGLATTAAIGAIAAQVFAVFLTFRQRPKLARLSPTLSSFPIMSEHILPLTILIIGHLTVVLTGFVLSSLTSTFSDQGQSLVSSHAPFLKVKGCILYIFFSSVGCHLIAKRHVDKAQ